jgi:hypothetical protein
MIITDGQHNMLHVSKVHLTQAVTMDKTPNTIAVPGESFGQLSAEGVAKVLVDTLPNSPRTVSAEEWQALLNIS